jgi:hypothetical protein
MEEEAIFLAGIAIKLNPFSILSTRKTRDLIRKLKSALFKK